MNIKNVALIAVSALSISALQADAASVFKDGVLYSETQTGKLVHLIAVTGAGELTTSVIQPNSDFCSAGRMNEMINVRYGVKESLSQVICTEDKNLMIGQLNDMRTLLTMGLMQGNNYTIYFTYKGKTFSEHLRIKDVSQFKPLANEYLKAFN